MRIAVLRPQVPFSRGGAEIFTDRLVDELRARDYEAELVTLPFKWYPGARVLTQAFMWRLLDLDEADGTPIDVVVATKFPSYLVRHPNKRVWLVHQFRQAYELDRTELGQFGESPEDRALRRKVQGLDRVALGEAARLFTTSRNVAGPARALDGARGRGAPASAAGARVPLRRLRRLRALGQPSRPREAHRPAARGRRARRVARGRHRRGRARTGSGSRPSPGSAASTGAPTSQGVSETRSSPTCTRRCLAVFYAPVDEDFGMVPFEAFLSEKPVLTTTDAGGPLEVVADRRTGLVVSPEAAELARAAGWLREHRDEAASFGRAGKAIAAEVTWDRAIARLLS